jgi:hypothetical protein
VSSAADCRQAPAGTLAQANPLPRPGEWMLDWLDTRSTQKHLQHIGAQPAMPREEADS